MAGEKFLRIIKDSSKNALPPLTDIVSGVVTSLNPLKIKIEDRYELDSDFLTLSPFCIEKKIKIDNKDIILWEGLETNQKVLLLRVSNGQSFYVLE